MDNKSTGFLKPFIFFVLSFIVFQAWSYYKYIQYRYAVSMLKNEMISCADFLQKYRLQREGYPIDFMNGLRQQGFLLSNIQGLTFDLEWVGGNAFRMKHESKRRFGLFVNKNSYIYIEWDSQSGKIVVNDNVVRP